MLRIAWVACFVWAAISLTSGAETKGPTKPSERPFKARSARSTVSFVDTKDGFVVITDNRRFTVLPQVHLGPESLTVFLRERFWIKDERARGIECCDSQISVVAAFGADARNLRTRWTIKEPGEEGGVWYRFYRVTKRGCCDTPTKYSFFDLLTGRKLFTATTDIAMIGRDDDVRYFAYDSSESSRSHKGILQFGSSNRVIRRVVINGSNIFREPRLGFQSEGKRYESPVAMDIKGAYAICVYFAEGKEIIIPVENDELRLESATVPASLSLSETN